MLTCRVRAATSALVSQQLAGLHCDREAAKRSVRLLRLCTF